MPRLRAFVSLVFISSVVSAAPVPKPLKGKAVPSVAGTTWVGEHVGADLGTVEYVFEEGGKLTTRRQGRSHTSGTWRQDGDTIDFDVNNKYAEYTATFKDGQFDGTARNVKGKTWTVTLTRPAK